MAAGGRKASAAMPQMGYTCYLCPGQPSVITGGDPGDEQAVENARKESRTHLDEHAELIAGNRAIRPLVQVSPRLRSGPTATAQAAA
ncbi:hypothetical protein GA0070624_3505 [Micromonospora rhizosphaerae]|uniref:Uncharacterized protein n=1 Tax=Micromonospora rhizosphaerae TaxID=568872 RepID=A0A1C6SDA2_9ACTN|nr:hypothetical protein [Micromonospora rhizosphaerae]SCL27455.1 hypothetical protein GA0070624_3505 [Micromonospora rhizosphaerae]